LALLCQTDWAFTEKQASGTLWFLSKSTTVHGGFMTLLPVLWQLLQPFSQQMTAPTFASFCTLVLGWIFARRHNVTGALRACDHFDKHFCAYHRVFAAARWSLDAVGLALLGLVLATCFATGVTVFLVIDDTLCKKYGWKTFGVDSHYDAANTSRKRSNANRSLKRRGHCWVLLGLVLPLPWGSYVCLPLLFRLYMNTKGARRNHCAYRSRPDLGRDLLAMVCRTFPHWSFHLLVDSAYAGQDTLRGLPENCQMTARWQMKIRLCQPAAPKPAHTKGPAAQRGPLLPGPQQMLEGRCDQVELDLYGSHDRYRMASALACLYTVPKRLLRIVVTEQLTASGKPKRREKKTAQAVFYSTVSSVDALTVLAWYCQRWTVEVGIRDSKQALGCEQAQGFSEQAVKRTAPTLMLIHSLVVLWFVREGHRFYRARSWPWYPHKTAISFADMLATLRCRIIRQHLQENLQTPTAIQGSRKAIKTLLRLAKLAA
jgi:hypothetical protein